MDAVNAGGGLGPERHGAVFCWALCSLAVAPLLLVADPVLAINDNLDGTNLVLLRILKRYGALFAFDAQIPMLHGVSRLLFPAELKLWAFLIACCDDFLSAYRLLMILKVGIGYAGMRLFLDGAIAGGRGDPSLARMVAACFAVLPCQPENALSFASLPLILSLFHRLHRREKAGFLLPAAALCYPLLSDFSRYGLYLLAVLSLFWLYDAAARRRFHRPFLLGIVLLALGYVITEYRLFLCFLWLRVPTVRDEFRPEAFSYYTFSYILSQTWSLFLNGQYHFAQTMHKFLILPLAALVIITGRNGRRDTAMLGLAGAFALIVVFKFLYMCLLALTPDAPPILKSIQWDRVYIFLPLILYTLFHRAVSAVLAGGRPRLAALAVTLQGACILVIPSLYNEALPNLLPGTRSPAEYTVGEYFSEDLFRRILPAVNYQGEWSAALGLHPAILAYNGIRTLDGYHPCYPLAYKHAFRAVIAPELAENPVRREYFDFWGCRAYLFNEAANAPNRGDPRPPVRLRLDAAAFTRLGGRFIFSLAPIENSGELGLTSAGVFADPAGPYTVHVYRADPP
jgi:hypothetical protein